MNIPIDLETCLRMAKESIDTMRAERDQAMAEAQRDRKELVAIQSEQNALQEAFESSVCVLDRYSLLAFPTPYATLEPHLNRIKAMRQSLAADRTARTAAPDAATSRDDARCAPDAAEELR